MKSEMNPNCCRICLTKCKKLRSLYKPIEVGDEPPNGMLQKVAGITVEEMEKFPMLPKNICKNCELSLSLAFEFREKAIQSQLAIVEHMQELKIPYPEEEVKPTQQAFCVKKQENDLIEEKDNDLDEQTLEENLQRLDGSSPVSFGAKSEHDYDHVMVYSDEYNEETIENTVTCVLDDTSDSFNEEEVHELHYEQLENDEEDEKDPDDVVVHLNYEDEKHDEEEHHECDAESQEEFIIEKENKITWNLAEIEVDTRGKVRKGIRKAKIQPMKRPKAVSHICDICGNIYAKRGRMTEHRQRHDKELKFACELCDEKFHMRELLRKHMYSHSGGKPLKCKFCSRTFYYESVRKAHEAVHQGIKPYVCNVCGKSFSYSHSLKKHDLIHANVKLYRCEYCKKDFRLQHHMKQHKMTRLHKKTVSLAESNYADNSELDNDDDQHTEDVLTEEGEVLEDDEEEYVENYS